MRPPDARDHASGPCSAGMPVGLLESLAPGSGRTSHLGLLKRVCPCILRIRSIVALFDGLAVGARA
jgi:hypothetical protein